MGHTAQDVGFALELRWGFARFATGFLDNDVFLRVFGCQDSKRATRSLVNSIFRTAGIPEIDEILDEYMERIHRSLSREAYDSVLSERWLQVELG